MQAPEGKSSWTAIVEEQGNATREFDRTVKLAKGGRNDGYAVIVRQAGPS